MKVWVVMSFLGGWLGLTLVYQLFMPRLRHYVRRFDILWVLPAFRFSKRGRLTLSFPIATAAGTVWRALGKICISNVRQDGIRPCGTRILFHPTR